MSEIYSPVFSDAFAFKSLCPRLQRAPSITMPWCDRDVVLRKPTAWSCLAELMSKMWSIASRIWPLVRLQRT